MMGFLGSRTLRTLGELQAIKQPPSPIYKILKYEKKFIVQVQVPYCEYINGVNNQFLRITYLTTTTELAYFYEWTQVEILKKAKKHGASLKGDKWLICWGTEEKAQKFIDDVLEPQYTYLKLAGKKP